MDSNVDISKLLAGLGKARSRAEAAAIHALDVAGEKVLGDAQQLTPVDTGALQASATSEAAHIGGGVIQKRIGFNTSYAAAVHERLDLKHKIGQAKFLSTALRENAQIMNDFIAKKVRESLS